VIWVQQLSGSSECQGVDIAVACCCVHCGGGPTLLIIPELFVKVPVVACCSSTSFLWLVTQCGQNRTGLGHVTHHVGDDML